MPRLSCWWRSSRLGVRAPAGARTPPSGVTTLLVACGLLASAGAAEAATVLERSIHHTIGGDDRVLESTRLRVKMDGDRDYRDWDPYVVYLDDHRELRGITTYYLDPAGKRIEIKKRDHDTTEYPGLGVLHGSQSYRVVSVPALAAGSVLVIEHEVETRPYFPAGAVALGSSDLTVRLDVEVRGAPEGFRWYLEGSGAGLKVEPLAAGGVRVIAEALPGISAPDWAPGDARDGPVLRYAWGPAESWADVGAWYESLLRGVADPGGPLAATARDLAAGAGSKREALEALLAFARRQVRYVAVEVGIGGYQPSPPPEVLERRWGDCKDKSLLLVGLLRQVGIDAFPALIRAARRDRIEEAFPSPQVFNHLIVAVPTEGLEVAADDPVAEGLLFIDPTQEQGSGRWLQPDVQDQSALVVRPGASSLVHTPLRPAAEARRLEVRLGPLDQGIPQGRARLGLSGAPAAAFEILAGSSDQEELASQVRTIFGRLLPGVDVRTVSWGSVAQEVPETDLEATVALPGVAQRAAERLSLQLPGLRSTPRASELEEREEPVVLAPGVVETSWLIDLPDASCRPAKGDVEVDNPVGKFEQRVTVEGRQVRVERRTEIRQRWVEPESFEDLRQLSLAEHRTIRRRVRLDCPGSAEAPASGTAGP